MKLETNNERKRKTFLLRCIDVIRFRKQSIARNQQQQEEPFFEAAETVEDLKEAYESYMTVMLE